MVEIIALCAAALLMICVYCKTKRPKLYALLNTAAGIACLLLLSGNVNRYNAALAAVFGVPGALLNYIMGLL